MKQLFPWDIVGHISCVPGQYPMHNHFSKLVWPNEYRGITTN